MKHTRSRKLILPSNVLKLSKAPNTIYTHTCTLPFHHHKKQLPTFPIVSSILTKQTHKLKAFSFTSERIMAEKTHQAAPANGYTISDRESLVSEDELKRQKRIKLFAYIGIFVVFQIIVITVFSLTVMKVKTPKVRLGGDSTLTDFTYNAATPSFGTTFNTQIRVKNTNWGPYKFDAGIVTFMYQGTPVGTVGVPKSKAGMRSTKKINAKVSLNTDALKNSSTLGSELSGGVLTLTSEAKLTGKVELMFIMKKKKSASMNCTIQIDVSEKTVKSLQCK